MSTLLKSAVFSEDRAYRYQLTRTWDETNADICAFIGLNPSTADETEDDPTIRRCIDFARQWGHGGLIMLNLFAFRATDPKVMKAAADPIGPENIFKILEGCERSSRVVAAWGVHGSHMGMGRRVAKLMQPRLECLGTTKAGHPRHPLYLRKDTKPAAFN